MIALLQGRTIDSEWTPIQLAFLFTNSALLVSAMEFIEEQYWLQNQAEKGQAAQTSYQDFLTPFFEAQLEKLSFLKEHLMVCGSQNIKKVSRLAQQIESKVIQIASKQSSKDQKQFLVHSLQEMSQHFLMEEKAKVCGGARLRIYRTFDKLDEVFDLNYKLDLDMDVDHQSKERLYQGSGVGVQSGYSTILLALENIALAAGSKVVDLGSGYGRVGLVCSLLNPDVEFVGYEYVPHRALVSNKASEALGLSDTLHFAVQDLSLPSFKIPKAQVYYLYDPFTKETYDYVLEQIVAIALEQKVTIVTKGNAREWLLDIANDHSWPEPVYLDEKNLCIFNSR